MTSTGPSQNPVSLRSYSARLRMFDAICQGAREAGVSPMSFWQPTVEKLRFRLGTGLGDVRVPIAVASEVPHAFEQARRGIFGHFINRHRKLIPENIYDMMLGRGAMGQGALTLERTPQALYSVPHGVANPRLRVAVAGAFELCPYFDCGMFVGWLSGAAAGMGLLKVLTGSLRKAVSEALQSEEETPYLLQAYLLRYMADARSIVRQEGMDAAIATHAEATVAVGIHVIHYAAVEQVLQEVEEAGRPVPPRLAMLMRSLVNPAIPIGGSAALRRVGGSLYGVDPTLYRALGGDEYLRQLAEGGAAPARMPEDVAKRIGEDKALRQQVEEWLGIESVRWHLHQAIIDERWASVSKEAAQIRYHLLELYREPAKVSALLRDKKMQGEMVKVLEAREAALSRGSQSKSLSDLRALMKRYKHSAPLKTLGSAGEAALQRFVHGFTCLVCDLLVERAVHPVHELFADKGVLEVSSELESEYRAGRVYLIGRDEEMPVLAQRARAPEMAHLFSDIKDFTRRTVLLEEDVMADFLERHFYAPILRAAREHFHGMSHYWDKGGVVVNNLLGDAISFSGDVIALVEVARQIQRILTEYERKLGSMLTSEVLTPILQELEARYGGQYLTIDQELGQIKYAMSELAAGRQVGEGLSLQTPGDLKARQQWLLDEKKRLEEEKLTELEAVKGAELQAGTFLAFGSAPRVVEIEDPVWGQMRVSIASKINESARGTARTAALREWIDDFVREQRTRPGYDRFVNPFKVLIGGVMGAPEGFYNIGVAMSLEALRAYIEAQGERMVFVEHAMGGHDVHPEVVKRFCLPRGRLDLVVGLDGESFEPRDVFVYAGAARFKGFESRGTTDVYEHLDPGERLYRTLAQVHAGEWRRMAAAQTGRAMGTGLHPVAAIPGEEGPPPGPPSNVFDQL